MVVHNKSLKISVQESREECREGREREERGQGEEEDKKKLGKEEQTETGGWGTGEQCTGESRKERDNTAK